MSSEDSNWGQLPNLVRSLYKIPKPNLWRWRSKSLYALTESPDGAKPQPIPNRADVPLVEVEEFGCAAPWAIWLPTTQPSTPRRSGAE